MTERVSIDEARRRGWLDGGPLRTTSERETPELRSLRDDLRRREWFFGLVQALLEHGRGGELRLEHQFHPRRRWRLDLALLDVQVALEIDGGGWIGGRHHREAGRRNDNEKSLEAQRRGWILARVSWEHVKTGEALELLRRLAREREESLAREEDR